MSEPKPQYITNTTYGPARGSVKTWGERLLRRLRQLRNEGARFVVVDLRELTISPTVRVESIGDDIDLSFDTPS